MTLKEYDCIHNMKCVLMTKEDKFSFHHYRNFIEFDF